jgi:hypothetical protein
MQNYRLSWKPLVTLALIGSCVHSPLTSSSSSSGGPSSGGTSSESIPSAGSALDEHAFYTISTMVDGEELALTFLPPEGSDIRTIVNNAGKSKVELRKLTGSQAQRWQPHQEGEQIRRTTFFTKLTDPGAEQGGVLEVYHFDKRLDDPSHSDDDKYNRLTVGGNSSATQVFWRMDPVAGGKYRLKSEYGMSEHPEQPGEEEWDAPRALEAVKGATGVRLRNMPIRETATQYWTLTKTTN